MPSRSADQSGSAMTTTGERTSYAVPRPATRAVRARTTTNGPKLPCTRRGSEVSTSSASPTAPAAPSVAAGERSTAAWRAAARPPQQQPTTAQVTSNQPQDAADHPCGPCSPAGRASRLSV